MPFDIVACACGIAREDCSYHRQKKVRPGRDIDIELPWPVITTLKPSSAWRTADGLCWTLSLSHVAVTGIYTLYASPRGWSDSCGNCGLARSALEAQLLAEDFCRQRYPWVCIPE